MTNNADKEQGGIASRLRLAREMAGLTQGQAANRLGLHRPTISELEAGRRRLATGELREFSELYDVSTTWLLGEDQDDEVSDRVRLAARQLQKLTDEDLNRLMTLLRSLKRGKS